ncbi:shikimate dehydrogenase [Acidobacteriota bacterium]
MAKKVLFGLLGENLSHSFSPLMFNHYFKKYKPNIRYDLFPVTLKSLPGLLKRIRESGTIGLNVTVPYKEKIIPFLDELNHDAKKIGAVNVIRNNNGRLKGYNTDYLGFLKTLEQFNSMNINKSVILGAGGAARSVIYSFFKLAIRNIIFFARKIQKVSDTLAHFTYIPQIKGALWEPDNIKAEIKNSDIAINTTPVGMFPSEETTPIALDFPVKNQFVAYDLIYNPRTTQFLKIAQSNGAIIENGQRMLIYQALESLKIWNKREKLDEEYFIKSSEEVLNASLSKLR